MRRWNRKNAAATNVLIAVLMLLLYVSTATPLAKEALSYLYQSPVYRGHAKDAVALSCAVSWNAAALPALLELLEERNVTATFYVSGDWAKSNQDMLRGMARAGHEIGTLGQTPLSDGDAAYVKRDIAESLHSIEAVAGVQPRLYHSGLRDKETSSEAAGALGLLHVLCTVDLLSARGDTADIASRALENPFDGSIILMQPTSAAVEALPVWLDAITAQGRRIVPVSEVLGERYVKDV